MFSSCRFDRPLTAACSALLWVALAVPHVEAQQPDRQALERLERAYSAEVVDGVADVLERADAEGLPTKALADKAREGAAKRVPDDRLVEALERRRAGLARAAEALGEGADPASVKAGATALSAGVGADAIRRIGSVAAEATRPTALLVLGELHRLEVPVERAAEAVARALEREAGAAGLWALGARVRAAVREGRGPEEAVATAVRGPVPLRGAPPALLPSAPGGLTGPPVPPGSGPPSEGPAGETGPPGDDPPSGPPSGSGAEASGRR